MNDVTSPLCSGACALGSVAAGAFFRDIYPVLTVVSCLCGSVLGIVGILRLAVETLKWLRKSRTGDRLD